MKRLSTLLLSLSLSLSAMAAEPVLDTSSWEKYSASSKQLTKGATSRESTTFQQAINSYAAGLFLPKGNAKPGFAKNREAYLKNLSPLNGLTFGELMDQYNTDLIAIGLPPHR